MSRPRALILGGGPAAAGVALTLAEAGVQALVLERATVLRDKPGECLSASFRPLLERLRLLDALAEHRRIPAFHSRWDHDAIVERDAILSADGEGWLLDRRRFEAQLIAAAVERGAVWQLGWTIAQARRRGAIWLVELARNAERRSVEADVLVDATGRSARLLRMLGESRRSIDRLFGSWLILPARGRSRGDGPVAIEADNDGWWYATSLADGRSSLVWFSDRPLTRSRDLLTRARERELIARFVPDELGDLPEPSVHPAGSARASRPCGPGWFAVGDAAQAFDPLSSHGIGSALGTGYYAAQALLADFDGHSEACADYRALLDQRWAVYLVALQERYAAAHAWSNHRFWVERRQRIAAGIRADGDTCSSSLPIE